MKIDPVKLTIEKAASLMACNELSSYDLTAACLNRIQSLNENGPALRAVLEVSHNALDEALQLDQERRENVVRSLVHGIPILLKDNISTCDNLHTSAGSLALEDNYALRDAFIVKKLREAGAVIIGKANMTEWANFISYSMPDGFSARGGIVKSYLHPFRFQVGGSSSGCAVGVSAGFALAAIGTETSGSIIKPSVHAAIVGFKPSIGLVSRSGIIPISISQDTVGPMTKSVADAAILLDIMTGKDDEDLTTVWAEQRHRRSANSLKTSLKIGFLKDFYGLVTPPHKELIEATLHKMEEKGHQVIVIEGFPAYESIYDETSPDYLGEEVLIYEFKEALEAYLQNWTRDGCFKTLREIIQYNEKKKAAAIPYGQELFYQADAVKNGSNDPVYFGARERDYRVCDLNGLGRVFAEKQVDMVICPHFYGCTIPARAGYPALTLPLGVEPELGPTALTLIGKKYDDESLLQMARVLENILK